MNLPNKVLTVDECLDSLTTMTKAGCENREKEPLVNAIGTEEFYAMPSELFEKIKNALITVAAIKAFGVNKDLQNYFEDIK